MENKHKQKFIINILLGITFTSIGILAIMYVIFTKPDASDKTLWSAIPLVTINAGLLFMVSAIVHKVKADLIRKQKQRNRNEKENS